MTEEPVTLDADSEVVDEAAKADGQATDVLPRFDITSYGADYPVDALVKGSKLVT